MMIMIVIPFNESLDLFKCLDVLFSALEAGICFLFYFIFCLNIRCVIFEPWRLKLICCLTYTMSLILSIILCFSLHTRNACILFLDFNVVAIPLHCCSVLGVSRYATLSASDYIARDT